MPTRPNRTLSIDRCRSCAVRHGTAEQVEAVSERMERRKLTAVAPIAKAADPSHPNGRPLRYTNQNRFTASTNGTASAVGSAAREMWVKLARSRTYKPVYDALPYAFTRKARRIDMMRSLQGHAEKLCLADLPPAGARIAGS